MEIDISDKERKSYFKNETIRTVTELAHVFEKWIGDSNTVFPMFFAKYIVYMWVPHSCHIYQWSKVLNQLSNDHSIIVYWETPYPSKYSGYEINRYTKNQFWEFQYKISSWNRDANPWIARKIRHSIRQKETHMGIISCSDSGIKIEDKKYKYQDPRTYSELLNDQVIDGDDTLDEWHHEQYMQDNLKNPFSWHMIVDAESTSMNHIPLDFEWPTRIS